MDATRITSCWTAEISADTGSWPPAERKLSPAFGKSAHHLNLPPGGYVWALWRCRFNTEVIISSSLSPGVEIVVAGSLLYYLWQRRAADFNQFHNHLDYRISGFVQLVLFLTRRNDLSWLVCFLIQAKLFSNSLLASLNGRKRFRSAGNHVVAYNSNSTGAGPTTNSDVVIRMHQLSEVVHDEEMAHSQGKSFYRVPDVA
ncbi:hypothetical protein DFH06DRAFT_1439271 [Mycena polygramma]|nr:hypothetical protein DFH06DRAFT_1439271 [Mycena polygramma]